MESTKEIRETEIGVALGSNLGQRQDHLDRAARWLATLSRDGRVEIAPALETAPIDCPPGSPAFLNTVAVLTTTFSPQELLAAFKDYEAAAGRLLNAPRNSPRSVDLDLIYHGDTLLDTPSLTLPHPRAAQRRFVLAPLSVLRPNLILPGHTDSIKSLLSRLPSDDNPPT